MEKVTFLFSTGQSIDLNCPLEIYDKIINDYELYLKTQSPKKIAYSIGGDGRPEFIVNPANVIGIFKLVNK